MNRCALSRRCLALSVVWIVGAGGLSALPAAAEVARTFPANALRGEITFTAPPEVLLNGQASRLSPGSRIHGQNNMLVVSGAAIGQKLVVNYTRDQMGQPHEIWILRPEEIAMKPWPRTPAEASAWQFDAGAQAWTKP